MSYVIDAANHRPRPLYDLGPDFAGVSPGGEKLSFNNCFLTRDGLPVLPVSGEFHYSRMDPRRWEDALIRLRMGGVTVIATYIFWNHHEADEGVFDFTGRLDLRRFVALCKKHGLYVILRAGPFDHGEVRNGGLPDWLFGKPFEVRSTDAGFLACVERLYAEIGRQVRGLFYRDGGPVIAVQLDNEYMHSSAPWELTTGVSDEWVPTGNEGEAYLLTLRSLALKCGLTPVFFTGTAWGGAAYSPRVMPLWGGYPYRPWLFYRGQGEHPVTEEYIYEDYHRRGARWADDFAPAYDPESRPYACCEMGGGMMCSYHYRFSYPYKSVDALANIKLGSGCNFIGYYMFQGGTNPLGRHGEPMNESQVPQRSYDYQAAVGEFGQLRPSYRRLKAIHHFARCFGHRLAPMETLLPEGASDIDPRDTRTLRFAVRTDGQSGFLFIDNFQDHLSLPERRGEAVMIRTASGDYRFDISLASDENAILPFHFDMDGVLLLQANAQPVARTVIDGRPTYVFTVPEGMDGAFTLEPGASITGGPRRFTVQKGDACVDVIRLTREACGQLYILRDGSLVLTDAALLEDPDGALRLETTRAENTLLCYPARRLSDTGALRLPDADGFGAYRLTAPEKTVAPEVIQTAPRRWTVRLPEDALDGLWDARLQIDYCGDIGRLFLENRLVHDNFCNGDTWEFGLMEYREALTRSPLVLTVAPIREGSRVRVDSPMAARSESAASLAAELYSVRIQPVYQIEI